LMRLRLALWRIGASGSFRVCCPIKRSNFIATVDWHASASAI
jgi:hypothetical protein